MHRLAKVFDGTGVQTAIGIVLLALAALFAFLVLSSSGGWQWFSAQTVAGREDTGTVAYTYRGQTYNMDDPLSFRSGPRTVWVNPANPSQAALSVTVARISDSLFVGVPASLGCALVATGLIRKRRRSHRCGPGVEDRSAFGTGIDSETISRIVAGRRHRV